MQCMRKELGASVSVGTIKEALSDEYRKMTNCKKRVTKRKIGVWTAKRVVLYI